MTTLPAVSTYFDKPENVRIYCEDTASIPNLRDFFSSQNLAIRLNGDPDEGTLYIVILGSLNFVKAIYESLPDTPAKVLFLVHTASSTRIKELIPSGYKAVQIDTTVLTLREIEEIFRFYVTGSESFMHIRTHVQDSDTAYSDNLSKQIIHNTVHTEPTQKSELPVQKQNFNIPYRGLDVQKTIDEVYGTSIGNIVTIKKRKRSRITPKKIFRIISVLLLLPIAWWVMSVVIFTISLLFLYAGYVHSLPLFVAPSAMIARLEQKQLFAFVSLTRNMTLPSVVKDQIHCQELFLSAVDDLLSSELLVRKLSLQIQEMTLSFVKPLTKTTTPGITPVSYLDEFSSSVPALINHIGLAESELSALTKYPGIHTIAFIDSTLQNTIQKLQSVRTTLDSLSSLLLLYKGIGGFSQPSRYLVLFQNNLELRPTGGFIGSTADLEFTDGLISSFEIRDVYDLDGQLKGHVDPPKPIRDLIGQEHWYLRDSNWNPDFTESAKKALWFYEAEQGRRMDGVIAVTLPVITELLKISGPLPLSDYNDTITAENFAGKAFYYIQSGFFPGSTQKKDFLGSVARVLFQNLSERNNSSDSRNILQALLNSLDSHDIQMFFSNPHTDRIVAMNRWRMELEQPESCGTQGSPVICRQDVVIPIEANVSTSKVNLFVEREYSVTTVLGADGTAQITTAIDYSNSAEENDPGRGGDYRNYHRFYISSHASDIRVMVDGVDVPHHATESAVLSALPYQEMLADESGYTVVGVAFAVPAGAKKTVTMAYRHTLHAGNQRDGSEYVFTFLKQPGIPISPLRYRLLKPVGFPMVRIESGGKTTNLAKDAELLYNSAISGDIEYRFRFGDSL